MVVQHNLTAMNSNRMLGLTTGTQAKSTEKLSSGYKINRAADDAAGLSISEKMRKQIRGLTQASLNAEDGISAVQTAEGALNEVQDMLQRMNELAVKAANGTMSENDRSYVQNEIDQLVTEIDRVSETTKFNETYLLRGDSNVKSADSNVTVGGQTIAVAADLDVKLGDYVVGTVGVNNEGTDVTLGVTNDAVSVTTNSSLEQMLNKSTDGTLVFTLAGDAEETGTGTGKFKNADAVWTVKDGAGNTISLGEQNKWSTSQLASLGIGLDAEALKDDSTEQLVADNTFTVTKTLVTSATQAADLVAAGITGQAAGAYKEVADVDAVKDIAVGNDLKVTMKADAAGKGVISAYDASAVPNPLNMSLHVGADSTTDNKISMKIESMSAKGLGLRTATGEAIKVDGKDSKNADKAIDTITAAIQKVSTQRSALGAVQNRLEHTIANLDNVVENTTAAESQIRDTDMATEMVKYSNNNILAQAGQAMLAQANQSNQGILSLLG